MEHLIVSASPLAHIGVTGISFSPAGRTWRRLPPRHAGYRMHVMSPAQREALEKTQLASSLIPAEPLHDGTLRPGLHRKHHRPMPVQSDSALTPTAEAAPCRN